LCTESNVGTAGVWRFQIRSGAVMCPDAGMQCNTGMHGICGEGRMQCVGSGTTCEPINTPQPPQCNGLDNDCDGVIDTGPCPAGSVCDGAQCVPQCVEGGCFDGQVCTAAGTCVDTECASMTCPAGQRCSHGTCGDTCTGVHCPGTQVCRLGACVDPCAGVQCGSMQVCEAGLCVPTCSCRVCPSGQMCASDGHCVESACANMTCGAGQNCSGGSCHDACEGAVCPSGQTCTAGMCSGSVAQADGGVGGDDASVPTDDGGGFTGYDAGDRWHDPSQDPMADASTQGPDGGPVDTGELGGCRCRAAGHSDSRDASTVVSLAALVGIALATRSRRRGRATR
jgi:hypothetical protein